MKKPLRTSVLILLFICFIAIGCMEQQEESKDNLPDKENTAQIFAYDLNNPKDKVLLYEKLQSDVSEKKTYVFTETRVFGVRPDKTESLNEFGKELFRYSSCEIKIKRVLEDGNIEGKSKIARIYQDPVTNKYIEKIKNPYHLDTLSLPIYISKPNGGIMTPNGPFTGFTMQIESTAIGKPLNFVITELEEQFCLTRHSFTKWYSKKNNSWRTRMGMDTYYFDKKYMMDRSFSYIPSIHTKMSQDNWIPQLNLANARGHMTYTSIVRRYFSKDKMPKDFVSIIETQEPNFFDAIISWN